MHHQSPKRRLISFGQQPLRWFKSKVLIKNLYLYMFRFNVRPETDSSGDSVSDKNEDSMVGTRYAGDINQALIELGSTVCKPRDPDCGACPLQPWCRAFTVVTSTEEVLYIHSKILRHVDWYT